MVEPTMIFLCLSPHLLSIFIFTLFITYLSYRPLNYVPKIPLSYLINWRKQFEKKEIEKKGEEKDKEKS